MKFSLASKPWNLALPSAFIVLAAFLIHTFIYPLVIYKLYYPEMATAGSMTDFDFIESHTDHGIGVAIKDDADVVEINLDGKLLVINKDLSGFAFSGKVMRLVDQDGNGLTGFVYESMPSKEGRNIVRFVRGDGKVEFKFYDDTYIIRAVGARIGGLQIADTFINTYDAHIAVGDIQDSTGSGELAQSGSSQDSQEMFVPVYKVDGVYIDRKFEQMHTSRDTEIAGIFKEIQEKTSVSTDKKYVPKSPKPKYSFQLVDGYTPLGATEIKIPKGQKQEIKFTHNFSRSIGSESYISADTFQGDPTAVDEILKMGGLDFIKQNSVFYDESAKVGYLDYDMKKFVELKLKSEQAQYIGKRGKDIIYQGKEDTYIYTMSPGEREKIKETILLREARAINSYTYEVIGNYKLEKNKDGSVTLLGQNLNKSGLTETCSDEYYETEKSKRENDIKTMDEASLLKKYGKEKVSDIDITEFCVSPKILKEKKKEIPYDVPVFRLERPVTFGADESEVPLDVAVTLSGSEVTYSFDTTTIDKSLFPLRFDPTLTTDAELKNADISSFTVNGGTGLGTTPTGGPLGAWAGTTTMNTARWALSTIAYNGYIYAVGGFNGSSHLSSTEYAPINSNGTLGTWTATTSMTATRRGHGVIAYNGYIYAVGGFNGSSYLSSTEYAPINSNGTLGAWTATTSMTSARAGHAIVIYNGYIYAISGSPDGSTYLSSTEYASIRSNGSIGTWTTSTNIISARWAFKSVVYNGYVYVIGGNIGATSLSSTQYASINSNGTLGTWTSTSSMTMARGTLGAIAYNGYIYAIGGHDAGSAKNSTEYAPINSNGTLGTWTATTNMTTSRSNAGTEVYNNFVYAIGGGNATGSSPLATTEYARIQGVGGLGNWTASTSMLTGRNYHKGVVYNGYIYSVGGWNGSLGLATTEYAPINSNGTLGTWAATTSMTVARYNHGLTTYNGYIYAIGGHSGGSVLSSTEYAPINANGTLGTWTATTSMTTVRREQPVVVLNGYIYAIGGHSGGSVLSSTEYAPINANGTLGTWTATTSMTTVRSSAGAIVYNSHIYITGGSNGSSYLSSTEYAPINANGTLGTWTATTNMIVARYQHAGAIYNGYIYSVGGWNGGALATTEYAPINANGTLGTWTATTNMIVARYQHAGAIYNGYIYVSGGANGVTPYNTTEYAPIANNVGSLGTWTATTSMTSTRSAHQSVAYNGYMYAVGGYNGGYLTTVHYAPINANGTLGTWAVTTAIAASRYDFGLVTYNGRMYIIGGWNGTTANATTAYAVINSNGTLGTWFATTSMTTGRAFVGTAIHNGYIYAIGGWNAANLATTEYAPINANGTLGTWTATTSMTVARLRHGVVTYNGYIYALGYSYGSAAAKSNTTEYAPINSNGTLGTWTATTRMIIQRGDFGIAVFGGYIYVVGGTIGTSVQTTISEFAPINSNGTLGNWSENRKLASARYGNRVIAYNGYVYTIGGYNGSAYLSSVEYAPINGVSGLLSAWTATTSMTSPRSEHGSVAYNGYIYAVGGYNGPALSSTEYAPINSNGTLGAWTTTTSMNVARSAPGIIAYNGYIYAIGGRNVSTYYSDTEYAPINSNGTLGPWTTTTSMNVARSAPGIIAYNGYIYAIGGRNVSTYYSDTEYAPINSNGTLGPWTTTTSMITERSSHGVATYNGFIYTIGGGNSVSTFLSTEYAPINSNGTLGAWTTTTSMNVARVAPGIIAYNGYIYAIANTNGPGDSSIEYAPINSNGTLGTWTATTGMEIKTRYRQGTSIYNGYIYSVGGMDGGVVTATTEYAKINHTPQSAIQQLWHKTYDKGSSSSATTYVSVKYNTQIDTDSYIRYRLWDNAGTTAVYRSQWIPLESYKTGLSEWKVTIPSYGLSYRYLDFEIMRISSQEKVSNNLIAIGYGLNSCLVCSGVDVVISSACVLTTDTTCVLNNIEITSAGTLEVQSPAVLDFDFLGHNILIRNGGQFLIRNGAKAY